MFSFAPSFDSINDATNILTGDFYLACGLLLLLF